MTSGFISLCHNRGGFTLSLGHSSLSLSQYLQRLLKGPEHGHDKVKSSFSLYCPSVEADICFPSAIFIYSASKA